MTFDSKKTKVLFGFVRVEFIKKRNWHQGSLTVGHTTHRVNYQKSSNSTLVFKQLPPLHHTCEATFSPQALVFILFHKSCRARQEVHGRAKARHPGQNRVVLLLVTKHVGKAETCVSKDSSCERTNLEHVEEYGRFDVSAWLKQ